MGILRLLLALSVVSAHDHGKSIFGFRFLYGNLAVECFYMVSGFYMALVLHERYNRRSDYLPFLWQRAMRLMPAYWVILVVMMLVYGLLSLASHAPQFTYKTWAAHAHILSPGAWIELVAANLFIVSQQFVTFQALNPSTGTLFFSGDPYQTPVPASLFIFIMQSWTLDVEITFYILAPLLVRLSALTQILIFASSIILRLTTHQLINPIEHPWHLDRFFPYELAFFLAGSIGYQIYRHQQALLARVSGYTNWFRWVFLAIVVLYSRLPLNTYTREAIFMPLLFVMIPVLFNHTKNNRIDRLVGELSYPLYLVHGLVINLMMMWVPHTLPESMQGPAYAAMAIGVSYVIYRRIDEKVDNYRHQLFKRARQNESKPDSSQLRNAPV